MTRKIVDKIGEVRTVDRVLTMMADNYSMTVFEKITKGIKKISTSE